MSKENPTPQEQLFLQLVTSYSAGAWISMGKMKNPVSDKLEPNPKQAAFSIEMLEMLQERFTASLAEWEAEYLSKVISDLKLNYVTETNRGEAFGQSAETEGEASQTNSEE